MPTCESAGTSQIDTNDSYDVDADIAARQAHVDTLNRQTQRGMYLAMLLMFASLVPGQRNNLVTDAIEGVQADQTTTRFRTTVVEPQMRALEEKLQADARSGVYGQDVAEAYAFQDYEDRYPFGHDPLRQALLVGGVVSALAAGAYSFRRNDQSVEAEADLKQLKKLRAA